MQKIHVTFHLIKPDYGIIWVNKNNCLKILSHPKSVFIFKCYGQEVITCKTNYLFLAVVVINVQCTSDTTANALLLRSHISNTFRSSTYFVIAFNNNSSRKKETRSTTAITFQLNSFSFSTRGEKELQIEQTFAMKTQLLENIVENNEMKIKTKATTHMCNNERNTIGYKIMAIDLMTTGKRQ